MRLLVRSQSGKADALSQRGAEVAEVDFEDEDRLIAACRGASCVVSALSGLQHTIVEVQTRLLDAAVKAGAPRFIPSDFSIDFGKLPPGNNRNLDLRREFRERLDRAAIQATSILNGMFSELLLDQAPFVLVRLRRVLYFGDADQPMDFTTKDDVAAFTAAAAMDPSAPRFLRISGQRLSARGLAEAASRAMGQEFRLLWGGSLGMLSGMARFARLVRPGRNETYPAWQGMQYMRDMFDGRGLLEPLDNERYPGICWTSVETVLSRLND